MLSLHLIIDTGNGDVRRKDEEMSSYWGLAAPAKTMKSMKKKQRQELSREDTGLEWTGLVKEQQESS